VTAPLLPLALALAGGVWVGLRLPPPAWLAPAGLALAALAAAAARARPATVASAAVIVLAALAGWARVPLPDPFPAVRGIHPGPTTLEGIVGAEPEREGPRTQLPLVLRAAGEPARPAAGLLSLSIYGAPPPLGAGDHLRVVGEVRVREPFRNPGTAPDDPGPRTPRLFATARADDVTPLPAGPLPWWLRARLWIHAVTVAHLPPVSASLLEGLLIGERRQLPPTLLADFRRAGVLHVLAISGFNVALVAGAAFLLLRLVRLPRAPAAAVALVTLLAFAAVVGGQPSVLRATVMGGLFLVAGLLGRESRAWNSLALALAVLLLLDPGSLAEPGLQLSFAATAGLLHLSPWLRARLPGWWPAPLRDALAVSAGAQLGVTPVMLAHWGQLSPLGVLANLFVVPLAALLTVGGLLALAAATVSAGLAHPLFESLWVLLVALRLAVRGLAALPGAMIQLPPLPPAALAAAGAALILLPLARRRAGWTAVAALAGIAGIGAGAVLRPDGLARVVVLDVGPGAAVLVQAPDGPALLIDTGGGGPGRGDRGERVVVPALRQRGVRRLAALALTGASLDRRGGLAGILGGIAVGEVWLPAGAALPAELASGPPAAIPRRWLAAGDHALLGALLVTALHPPPAPSGAPGDPALVLRVEWGLFAAVLAADADAAAEAAMLAGRQPVAAPVLGVAAHGSRRGSSPAWLQAVGPRFAAIQVGARNPFGHPAPVVLARLGRAGATVYRTDQDGAIEFTTDGARLWTRAWGRPGPPEEFRLRGGP